MKYLLGAIGQARSGFTSTGLISARKLTLHGLSYDWQSVPAAGGKVRDSGSAKGAPLPSSNGS